MKVFIIFSIFVFMSGLIFISFLGFPGVTDLELDKRSDIYAGEGENCLTPYSQIKCESGLECVLTSTSPHKTGICLPIGTKLEEDFINRYPLDFGHENKSVNKSNIVQN